MPVRAAEKQASQNHHARMRLHSAVCNFRQNFRLIFTGIPSFLYIVGVLAEFDRTNPVMNPKK
jgi:hypothetical protein